MVRLCSALTEAGWDGHVAGVRAACRAGTLPASVAGPDGRVLVVRQAEAGEERGDGLLAEQLFRNGGRTVIATEYGPERAYDKGRDKVRTVRMSPELWARAQAAAEQQQVSVSEIVRAALVRLLGGEG